MQVNIWPTREADAQAKNMTQSLAGYERVTVYLSIPPFVFGDWSKAAADNWAEGSKNRVHIAAEKPFGTSTSDADSLHASIISAVPEDNLHLVDHWLSFFMDRHLPAFRSLVQPRLTGSGEDKRLEWSGKDFSKIVVTEYETRGLEGYRFPAPTPHQPSQAACQSSDVTPWRAYPAPTPHQPRTKPASTPAPLCPPATIYAFL